MFEMMLKYWNIEIIEYWNIAKKIHLNFQSDIYKKKYSTKQV
jgi:hypothetical protein